MGIPMLPMMLSRVVRGKSGVREDGQRSSGWCREFVKWSRPWWRCLRSRGEVEFVATRVVRKHDWAQGHGIWCVFSSKKQTGDSELLSCPQGIMIAVSL